MPGKLSVNITLSTFLKCSISGMRVEMASMKRDAEHYSRQEHMELGKRYRELTDLLALFVQAATTRLNAFITSRMRRKLDICVGSLV
ncbi:hypothetical protein C1H46_026706 [Malus baccata]|uniref:Uncharacterized protein n=1 Tax=Malus baccata TaxID=106549 RepID=A0A540LN62_MALBA|nr:hypothetical protein C1H46_026706 [Malus baccata]